MINKKIGVLLLFALLTSFGTKAQCTTPMRIDEVLAINEDNFINDYGKRHGWTELFNILAGTVNVAGCYLTDDKSNPMKYPIPKGDALTQIQPRQHILFWTDGQPGRGTFYANFVLDLSKESYIALYDANGRTLIDKVTIPTGQVTDISYGRVTDSKGEWAQLKKVTPSTNSLTLGPNKKIDNFKQNDSLGIGMTTTAMAVVLSELFLLYIISKQIDRLSISTSERDTQEVVGATSVSIDTGQESGEIFTAIATALYEMSDDNHGIEYTVLMIHEIQRTYSPWSSKLHGLRQTPHK